MIKEGPEEAHASYYDLLASVYRQAGCKADCIAAHKTALQECSHLVRDRLDRAGLTIRSNYADSLCHFDERDQAAEVMEKLLDDQLAAVNGSILRSSNATSIKLGSALNRSLDRLLDALREADPSPDLSRRAYKYVLAVRGIASRAIQTRRELANSKQWSELVALRERQRQPCSDSDDPDLLAKRVEQLEAELSSTNARLEPLQPAMFKETLPKGTAVVEFLKSRDSSKPKGPIECYDAFVLTANQKGVVVEWIPLGEAGRVDSLIKIWRRDLTKPVKSDGGPRLDAVQRMPNVDEFEQPSVELRGLLWEPLSLGDIKHVVVCPDGPLALLPWNALPGETSGRFLIHEHDIDVRLFASRLPNAQSRTKPENPVLLTIGDLDYGPTGQDSTVLTSWEPLPALASEIADLQQIWASANGGEVRTLSGADATLQATKVALEAATVAHVATHGFQIGKDEAGLVLSHANDQPVADTILRADTVADLDLSGMRLAVLSACDSGLGNSVVGEGIFSMQRRFLQAGTQAVVASLWKVDDAEANRLMQSFFEQAIAEGASYSDALRAAQRTLAGKLPPSAWAAWSLMQ